MEYDREKKILDAELEYFDVVVDVEFQQFSINKIVHHNSYALVYTNTWTLKRAHIHIRISTNTRIVSNLTFLCLPAIVGRF